MSNLVFALKMKYYNFKINTTLIKWLNSKGIYIKEFVFYCQWCLQIYELNKKERLVTLIKSSSSDIGVKINGLFTKSLKYLAQNQIYLALKFALQRSHWIS